MVGTCDRSGRPLCGRPDLLLAGWAGGTGGVADAGGRRAAGGGSPRRGRAPGEHGVCRRLPAGARRSRRDHRGRGARGAGAGHGGRARPSPPGERGGGRGRHGAERKEPDSRLRPAPRRLGAARRAAVCRAGAGGPPAPARGAVRSDGGLSPPGALGARPGVLRAQLPGVHRPPCDRHDAGVRLRGDARRPGLLHRGDAQLRAAESVGAGGVVGAGHGGPGGVHRPDASRRGGHPRLQSGDRRWRWRRISSCRSSRGRC